MKNLTTKVLAITVLVIAFQSSFAQSKVKWTAPSSASSVKNPLAGNTSILKDAKVLYQSTCAPCHGEKGKGNGPAAASLNPKPADHSSAAVQGQTDGELFWKMSEGRNPMPAYKAILKDEQRWMLVNYLRTLKK